ncbi:DUF2164 domain-containing protein [Rubrivirga sp.]|uniref:DUF2164 domain-containing protein n=1 Tax=Rubrivirga sp. TaxID=1885344 RepID=UPI003B5161ED
MSLTLSDADRATAVAALRRWSADHLDEPLGDLAAGLLLEFVLEEIGPSIYNRALADAQRHLVARVADLDVEIGLEAFPDSARR